MKCIKIIDLLFLFLVFCLNIIFVYVRIYFLGENNFVKNAHGIRWTSGGKKYDFESDTSKHN